MSAIHWIILAVLVGWGLACINDSIVLGGWSGVLIFWSLLAVPLGVVWVVTP